MKPRDDADVRRIGGLLLVGELPGRGASPCLRALPLTALNDALRAVINEGAGAGAIARPMLILALCGVLSFAAALKVFRWR